MTSGVLVLVYGDGNDDNDNDDDATNLWTINYCFLWGKLYQEINHKLLSYHFLISLYQLVG